jgi:hypothetical protein
MSASSAATRGRVPIAAIPSAFDLAERDDVADEELAFLAAGATTRGMSLGGLRERWTRVRGRLSGLREEEVLWSDEPAAVAALRVFPPAGGSVAISYRQDQTMSGDASLKLFGVGFGGGVTAQIGSALAFTVDDAPLELVLHVRASGRRYRDERRNLSLTRVDFLPGDGGMDFEIRKISSPPPDPVAGGALWTLEKRLLLARSSGSEPVEFTYPEVARTASWNAGVAVPSIAAAAGLELDARITCESTSAYEVTFRLAHGKDYGFYAPPGEQVMVPYCGELAGP